MNKWLKSLFKTYFFILFPFIVVFTVSLYVPSDSDIGWHLKYGEYFFQNHRILKENIYTTMMPGYHWINSSWAIDLVTYLAFSKFGFYGLSVLGALVITGIFYFLSRAFKLTFWEQAVLFPIILFLEKPLFEVSFRGQLITLLFIGILYAILKKFEEGKKYWLIGIIPLFIFWSNLHGQFILGLSLLALWIAFYLVKLYLININQRKIKDLIKIALVLMLIFVSGIAATLINPFGLGIYQEALRHFGNPLQQFIIEWLPLEKWSGLWWTMIFWDTVVIFSLWQIYRRNEWLKNLPWIIPVIILMILSGSVRRYFWTMILVSIPVVRYLAVLFKPKKSQIATIIALFIFLSVYFFAVLVKAPQENIAGMNWDRFCYQFVRCSPKSAEYLVKNKIPGKMMTFYNWGGWLIWKYPEIKTSIDGRMHLWRDEKGYSAFMDYYPYEQNWDDIDKSDYDIVYMTPAKAIHRRLMELVDQKKWVIAYQDNFATVFVRKSLESKIPH
ncbi:hypothetical protein A2960_00445 [Candidatus Gottesmanbacteria bacterium RIFCSPLOWO2_01_FULL_39_12b]|uniref:Glycosyltransferase RgtA/B/C/D-like domain-containing protein n=1 Tax=Candidatus Gottesmanbacteria bacterium RIFCSPLOWO2_01_FULL_39_12b TaxID=1798388 RepID=A0A1F6APM2_9BACT|nr:MAG: hypothetical protein A2960_00445 [Candidatus Gottesmanbacteria bacterium RIFCSPLOWO2_01_FULL_39_12b]